MSLLFAYSKQKTSQATRQILLGWYAWKCTCKSASAMYKCALNDEASILRALRQSRTAMWASFFHFLCDQYTKLIIPDNFLLKIQKKSSMLRPWETVLLEYTNTHALEHRWYKNPFHPVLHCMLQCHIINPNPPPKSSLQFGPISCTFQTTIKHKIRHNIRQQLQTVGLIINLILRRASPPCANYIFQEVSSLRMLLIIGNGFLVPEAKVLNITAWKYRQPCISNCSDHLNIRREYKFIDEF